MADWRANPRKRRSIIWKLPVEELKVIVAKSASIADILRYFGLNNKGGNCKTLMSRVEYEGIDISHIKRGIGSNKGRKFTSKDIPLESILIKNSTFDRGSLKRRLILGNVLKNICSECGLEKNMEQ